MFWVRVILGETVLTFIIRIISTILNQLTVAVIGGGPSGLLMAHGLLQAGATVSIGNNTLELSGAVNGSGTFKSSSASNLVVNGSGDAGTLYFDQSAPGSSNTLNNFTLNRSAAGKAALGNLLNTTGAVDVQSGAELTTNGNLHLKSSATGTARVDDLSNNGGGTIDPGDDCR